MILPAPHRRRNGASLLEFTLVGIPLLFLLISVFEISRGMWIYHTLAHAIREGARYAAVHGQDCQIAPNTCATTVRELATRIKYSGVGLLPDHFENVVMSTSTNTVTCVTLQACLAAGPQGDGLWPALSASDAGAELGADLTIRGEYGFSSAIAMFWPGTRSSGGFRTFTLWASSRERIGL